MKKCVFVILFLGWILGLGQVVIADDFKGNELDFERLDRQVGEDLKFEIELDRSGLRGEDERQ